METVGGWNEADQYEGYAEYQWRPAEQHLDVAQVSEPTIPVETTSPELEGQGFHTLLRAGQSALMRTEPLISLTALCPADHAPLRMCGQASVILHVTLDRSLPA